MGAVLLVGAHPPANGKRTLRTSAPGFDALPTASLGEPDEALLEVVLRRLCRERFMELSEDAARFLSRRMPRTFAAAHHMAAVLDSGLVSGQVRGDRPVSLRRSEAGAGPGASPGWETLGSMSKRARRSAPRREKAAADVAIPRTGSSIASSPGSPSTRACWRKRENPDHPLLGAAAVPVDLGQQPRRILHGPRRRPARAGEGRRVGDEPGRADAGRTADARARRRRRR